MSALGQKCAFPVIVGKVRSARKQSFADGASRTILSSGSRVVRETPDFFDCSGDIAVTEILTKAAAKCTEHIAGNFKFELLELHTQRRCRGIECPIHL